MAKYKAAKNLFFKSLNKSVMVDETIELDKEYADHVNADLAKTFPDVEKVLVPLEEETAVELKKARRGKKAKTEE
ncbi:TPA: hypothetical protein ACHWY4_001378 [Streptococcus pyogenes]|nr:hypothetical protein [Streptococcus lutetiensis]MDY2776333.1 hypothetical protein [Streptococcus infantarius]HEP2713890.1 hypothetical protein [Streptococcus pyogenes]MDU7908442.1 hypothetical protein [Streptococcus lutetiensis]HEP4551855.1 hypothetical protein [Streptococcus pyogenes]HEP5998041.1 hypothetical protein [Streptococcus pyogenes]